MGCKSVVAVYFVPTKKNEPASAGPLTDDAPALSEDSLAANFFPVTTFIKGEIAAVKSGGVNPLMRRKSNGRSDSSWMKMQELDAAIAEFLNPVIDTANLSSLFEQKTFLDQTIGAFTFTYDPKTAIPDSFPLRHWDVYVSPETNKVTRIFLVKKKSDSLSLQLTWQSGLQAKIVEIKNGKEGKSSSINETIIQWNFDN